MLKLTDIHMTSTHAQNRTDKPTSTFRQLQRLLVALVVSCAAGFVHADIPDEAIDAYERGDYAKAYALVLPLAETGDASAEFALGIMYDNSQGVPQDHREAVAWYRKAAEQGHASAQHNLGVMYANGQGVPQDHREAAAWFRKAAEQGHVSAQFSLGVMYDNGQGVPQDHREAAAWFRKAAEQGHGRAQFNLGSMYVNGQGVPQDHREAAAWYGKAAEQDFSAAQNGLGVLYEHGVGVSANPVLAYMLYNLAAAQGNELATSNRNQIIDRLTKAQLDEAQALTRNWKVGQPLPTTTKTHKPAKKTAAPATTAAAAKPQSSPYPARPATKPGFVTCNTRCFNGDCYRTYADGKQVRFQAPRKYNSLSGNWEWDSGGC